MNPHLTLTSIEYDTRFVGDIFMPSDPAGDIIKFPPPVKSVLGDRIHGPSVNDTFVIVFDTAAQFDRIRGVLT